MNSDEALNALRTLRTALLDGQTPKSAIVFIDRALEKILRAEDPATRLAKALGDREHYLLANMDALDLILALSKERAALEAELNELRRERRIPFTNVAGEE